MVSLSGICEIFASRFGFLHWSDMSFDCYSRYINCFLHLRQGPQKGSRTWAILFPRGGAQSLTQSITNCVKVLSVLGCVVQLNSCHSMPASHVFNELLVQKAERVVLNASFRVQVVALFSLDDCGRVELTLTASIHFSLQSQSGSTEHQEQSFRFRSRFLSRVSISSS